MVEKRFRKDIFISALIIAIFIFGIGFFLGYIQDKFRINEGLEILRTSELDSESFTVEKEFFDVFGSQDCELQEQRLKKLTEDLGEIGSTLAGYDAKKLIGTKDYNYLKRKYFILELKTYSFNKQVSENCNDHKTKTILFFYDVENNEESLRQGYVLDVLVKQDQDVRIFSIDRQFRDDLILSSIKKFYGITQSPTLILNYQDKIEGFISEGELKEKLE